MMWLNDSWIRWTSGMGGSGMSMMFIFGLLILVVFFMFLLWLGRREKSAFSGYREKPLDILKRRYSQGEIKKEEFDKIKKDLKS